MNTLGIIGGMSPESTAAYYLHINRRVNQIKGGNHSAPLLLHSVEFQHIADCQKSGDWQQTGSLLAQSARTLQNAGAQGILLATNTMHKVAAPIAAAVSVPFLHILDAVAQAARAQGSTTVGLLGTRFTMQDGFYTDGLAERGIRTLVPGEAEQAEIHRIIFDELCLNHIRPESARYFYDVIGRLKNEGAQGVILGCTEICLLVNETDSPLPVFDSTAIHAFSAVDAALEE